MAAKSRESAINPGPPIIQVAVDKHIRSNIGKPKNITKQNKDILLIEVQSEKKKTRKKSNANKETR